MATTASSARIPVNLKPDRFDRILAVGAAVLLGFVLVALVKGQDDWVRVPSVVWAHLLTIIVALALTPVMLLRRRGDALHRQLGWAWAVAMFLTAFDSLFVRMSHQGGFSIIHILSVWTLIQVPIIVMSARSHNLLRHKRAVRGMVTGALLIAGFFTFPFDRMLGHWLFS